MTTSRLEAFSDAVLAIIITIMVLELAVPHEPTLHALRCQRSGVSIEVSPNSPRSAKSTASETPGGGGSAAGGTSSGA